MSCSCRALLRGDPLDDWEGVVSPHCFQQSQERLPGNHLSGFGKERWHRADMVSTSSETLLAHGPYLAGDLAVQSNYPDWHVNKSATLKWPLAPGKGLRTGASQSHRLSDCGDSVFPSTTAVMQSS